MTMSVTRCMTMIAIVLLRIPLCIKEGELFGYPLDQASNRKIIMKHRIVQLKHESDYSEDYSLLPKFLFPCCAFTQRIIGSDQLQLQVLSDPLSPKVQHLILKGLDKPSIERPDFPAPNYANIRGLRTGKI